MLLYFYYYYSLYVKIAAFNSTSQELQIDPCVLCTDSRAGPEIVVLLTVTFRFQDLA